MKTGRQLIYLELDMALLKRLAENCGALGSLGFRCPAAIIDPKNGILKN